MTTTRNDLNDYLQSNKMVPSLSWQDDQSGPKHAVVWTSICKLDGVEKGRGSGSAKRHAREEAAKNALETLKESEQTDPAAS